MPDFSSDQISALKELQKRRNSLSPEQVSALDELSARAGVGRATRQRAADDIPADAPAADNNRFATRIAKLTGTDDVGRGFVKAAQETGTNVLKFVKGATTGDFGPFDDPNVAPEIASGLQRQGTQEKTGAFIERGAEFAAGDAAARSVLASVPLIARGTGVLSKLVRSAAPGAVSGGVVTEAQGGSNKEAAVNAAAGGVVGPLLEGSGFLLRRLGSKLQDAMIRPTASDVASGFNVENLNKHGLSGMSLSGTLDAVHNKITSLAGDLRNVTKNAPGSIDLGTVLADTENELLSRASRLKNAGDISNIKSALEKFTSEAADLGGSATVDEAQTLKRAVGLKGAWSFGKADADTSMEAVANVYQRHLKEAIEKATPAGAVQAINKQLSELMPIEQALVRRIPVAARNNPLSLTDLMLLATGHPAAAAAHVTSRTMAGATATAAAGRLIPKTAVPATAAAQATERSTE